MTTHIMLDLETLDTKPSSVILTLGAVKFDPFNPGKEPWDPLYLKPSVDEQGELKTPRTISESTVEWWGNQSQTAQDEAFATEGRISVEDMLNQLRKYCVGADKFWAQGVTFDFGILENLYVQYNSAPPWQFYKVRDSRTLFDLLEKDPRKGLQQDLHNALADSYYQAISVQRALKALGVTK